jgi:DNA-directed RNA polymerase specialized sigma24 family protein
MDLASAFDELPEVHAKALRLHRAGADAARIAAELHIEKKAVAPLLRVAEAKLASLLEAPDRPGTGPAQRSGQGPDTEHQPDS